MWCRQGLLLVAMSPHPPCGFIAPLSSRNSLVHEIHRSTYGNLLHDHCNRLRGDCSCLIVPSKRQRLSHFHFNRYASSRECCMSMSTFSLHPTVSRPTYVGLHSQQPTPPAWKSAAQSSPNLTWIARADNGSPHQPICRTFLAPPPFDKSNTLSANRAATPTDSS